MIASVADGRYLDPVMSDNMFLLIVILVAVWVTLTIANDKHRR